jgi:protein involved in polysaccharide export with SLBB domain
METRQGRRRLAGLCGRGALIFLLALLPILATKSLAQTSSSGLTPEQLQQMLDGNGLPLGVPSTASPPFSPQQTILEPVGPPNSYLPPSRLEQIMSQRAGAALRQFGYDQLGVGRAVTLPQAGAPQDSYILGAGDEIVVTLRGQENSQYRVSVNRDGQIVLPRLAPIPASGRHVGEVRDDISAAVHRAFVATDAFVTVGQLRQISVYVTGEVNSPGVRLLTGLSSPIDAILVSGGVKKTGSLRNVRIVRAGREIPIDLYGFLTQRGSLENVTLADGDRIVVPALGRSVAVTGWVRRPGIYELAPGQGAIPVSSLISLAGGLEVRGKYRLSVLKLMSNGQSALTASSRGLGAVRDSEILFVQPSAQQTVRQAVLSGGTALAGAYSLGRASSLSALLRAPGALGETPYTLFGIVVRKDQATLLRTLIAFTPASVVNGNADIDLQSDDTVRLFSVNEARLLFAIVKAFRERRVAAEEALRAPRAADEVALSQQQYNATVQGSGSVGALPTQYLNAQQVSPASTGPATRNRPNDEREDIGELSMMVLTDRGLMPQRNLDLAQTGGSEGGPEGAQPLQQQFALVQSQSSVLPQSPAQPDFYGQQPAPSRYLLVPYADNARQLPYYQGQAPNALQVPDILPQNLERQQVGPGEVPTNQEVRTFGQLARQLAIDPLVLVRFMMDHEVTVNGAVRGPGNYIVGPGVSLAELVTAAGGTAEWADESGVQLVSTQVDPATGRASTREVTLPLRADGLANYIVKPRDDLRFNEVFTNAGIGSVTVQGELRHTGVYQLVRGERLSDLLVQAGGLTDVAYPYGAVFLRRSAAATERDGYRRAAQDVQNTLLLAVTRADPNSRMSPEAFSAMQGFVAQLRNQTPLGRVTITADPAVLAVKPQLDVLLEPGDVLFVPQRPSTVAVLGEVMQPGSYPFLSEASANEYIEKAGSYSQFADDDLTFIVLPDGTANKVERSWLSFNSGRIPPGSAIVVPRDVSPLDVRLLITQVTQILSQLAVTAASIAVISQNHN